MFPPGWTQERVTFEQMDAEHGGYSEWERLKQAYRSSDQLWTFSSPPESWAVLGAQASSSSGMARSSTAS